MKKHFLLLTAAVLTFSQCTQPDPNDAPEPVVPNPTVTSFEITPDEAAAEALAAREAITPSTRAKSATVSSVLRHEANVAAQGGASVNASLYVVNFEEQGGFAIVAADRRQPETIYAVSDEGTFPDPASLQDDSALSLLYARIEALASAPQNNAESAIVVTGSWQDFARADRLVQMRWGTGAPFNGSMHTTAICQIMSYHEWPATYDWRTIKSLPCVLDLHRVDPTRDLKITKLFNNVSQTMQGVELNENFGTLGYLCNPSKPYTFSDLMKEVDAQRPVYAHARTRHGCILFGYTWIMDGYLRQSRTVTPFQPKPIDPGILEPVNPGILPPIEKEPTKVQIRNLVHCNLGNDGVGNGYYLSTVFNLGTGATIPDDDVRDGDRAQGQVEYEDGEITITTGIQPLRRVIIDPDLPIVEPNQPIEFGLSN